MFYRIFLKKKRKDKKVSEILRGSFCYKKNVHIKFIYIKPVFKILSIFAVLF